MFSRLLIILIITITHISCDDELSPTTVSFGVTAARTEMLESTLPNIVDSYGPVIFLSKPATEDVAVHITTTGTAVVNEDYTFNNPVIIPKGFDRASVGLQFIDDQLQEVNEVGILKISEVKGIKARIDTATGKFLIKDNDLSDLLISLLWAMGGNTGSDNIDMDLYLWRETSPGSNNFQLVKKKTNHEPHAAEDHILSGLEPDGLYGLSYVYYKGFTDNFTFRVIFKSLGSSILEGGKTEIEFNPTYDVKNINNGDVLLREQFFIKKGVQYYNFTTVTVPENGS